ncbi:MAG TPA: protein kinase [Candidatus Eisenbacteria bacterium]
MTPERLGGFRIDEEIGAGGMGVVYRAHDEKLGRAVAIKVLPERVAADPERLARFDREARLLASLNHPNVAILHGLDQDGDTRFLVMELVGGESLEKRLRNGAMPLAKALPIALQVASALEAAHAQGIVHRDLKPGNVMLTPEGRVKLLDFGLAKMLSGDSGSFRDSGTRATTVSGYLMGTPGYMSPEQASGDQVDRRADVWAFGCLLFEMVSGKRAFGGESLTQMLTAILSVDPDWALLPADTPAGIRRLLRRCLAKDPNRRLHEMADARIEIEETLAPPSGATGEFAVVGRAESIADSPGHGRASPSPVATRAAGVPPWLVIAGLLLVIVLAGMAMPLLMKGSGRQAGREPGPRRYSIAMPDSMNLAGDYRPTVRISPDGRWLAASVYTADWQRRTLIEDLVTGAVRIVARPDVLTLGFSPDSREAYMETRDARWVEELSTGTLRPLRHDDIEATPLGIIWIDDGFIVQPSFGRPLLRLKADGSSLRSLAPIDSSTGEICHLDPRRIPGTDWILFTVFSGGEWTSARIEAMNLTTGERRRVLDGAIGGRATADGWLLHLRNTDLLAMRFDPKRMTVSGTARTVAHDVQFFPTTGLASYDVSDDGTLVYVTGGVADIRETFTWLDEAGNETPTAIPPGGYADASLSPDGTRVAMTLEGTRYQIGIAKIAGGPVREFTFNSDDNYARWSPDGRMLAYTGDSPRRAVMLRPVDGSEPARQLGNLRGYLTSWSRDGTFGLATIVNFDSDVRDIYRVSIPGGATEPWAVGPEPEYGANLSPDGRWVAYMVQRTGGDEAFVRPLEGPGGPWSVAAGESGEPFWSRDGRLLYLQTERAVYAYAVGGGSQFELGAPRLLFRKRMQETLCPAPDGRFLAILPNRTSGPRRVEVIRNWQALVTDEPRSK